MKQFNLIVTCKFSDFAQAYTGLDDSDECMAFIEEQDQMNFVESPAHPDKKDKFLTKADLSAIWDSWVEIRVESQMENNGIYILSLTAFTSVIECDCTDLEGILHDIIKRNI